MSNKNKHNNEKSNELSLHVEFAEWKDLYTERRGDLYYKQRAISSDLDGLEREKGYTLDDLYSHWVNKVKQN